MSTLNFYRVTTRPAELEPSAIYITPSGYDDLIDLFFTGDDKSVVYRVIGIQDVESAIQSALSDWVPERSGMADKFTDPVTIKLTGDVTGQAVIQGDEGVVNLVTTVVNSGSGGGKEYNIISLHGKPELDMSGSFNDYRIPMTVPAAYRDRIKDGNSWILQPGEVLTITGILNVSASNPYFDPCFNSWKIDLTVALGKDNRLFILNDESTNYGMLDSGTLWYYLTAIQEYYEPSPEEINDGAEPIYANVSFQLSAADSATMYANTTISGELLFTSSVHDPLST